MRRDVVRLAIAVPLVALLAWEVAGRMSFACDLLWWSESTTMTNLMKLAAGQPMWTDPRECNSFVYSPGVEWLAWLLLRPFGLVLEVRAVRAVVVACGVGAAACVAAFATRLTGVLAPGQRRGLGYLVAFCAALLVVFQNSSADVIHPDDLHMLHATATLLLVVRALDRDALAPSLVAAAVAGLGVLAKQTAGLTPVGAVLALVLGRRRRPAQAIAIVAAAAAATGAAVLPLLGPRWARFWLFELLASHGVQLEKTVGFLEILLAVGPWLPIVVATPAAAADVLRRGGERGRRYLVAWTCVGVTGVLPALLAYLKTMGAGNNVGIAGVWCLALAWPALVADPGDGDAAPGPFARLRSQLAIVVLLLAVPLRLPPPPEAHATCRRFVDEVRADFDAGRRVYVAHGTTPLIAAGRLEVPRFRSNSNLELATGHEDAILADIQRAFEAERFDRVYKMGIGLFPDVPGVYRETERITNPGQITVASEWFRMRTWGRVLGWPFYAFPIQVLERSPDPPTSARDASARNAAE